MDFLVTHLNPHDRLKRKKEADNIIDYINKNQLTNCLLMGDMNAHSPFDASWTDEHLENYAVISTFMAASLHDQFTEGRGFTPPAGANRFHICNRQPAS